MSFQQGLSGLAAASKNLDVIGNNVANAGTYGFKTGKAVFGDAYAASLQGSGVGDVGIGVNTLDVVQQFTQGNINPTNNPLDLAINGGGFFQLSNNGVQSYSRNGQFQMDEVGHIVNATGQRLMGFGADDEGNILAGSPSELQLNTGDIRPRTTTQGTAEVNLDSRNTVPTLAFDITEPKSFNYTTSMTVYDSLGNPRTFTAYYVKVADNSWEINASIDGNLVPAAGTLEFFSNGTLDTASSLNPITITTAVGGGADPVTFTMDFSGTTQFGAPHSVNDLSQDGFASGRMNGFTIQPDGGILARYSNGQSRFLGQVAIANFASVANLAPLGNNQWASTPTSGPALTGVPGTGSLGLLASSALEESNVDLTQELVAMITAQRVYQANAQTVKTQDSILQTIVNMR